MVQVQTVTLKGEKLQEIAYSSDSANATLQALASRQRLRHTTDLRRFRTQLIKDGHGISEVEYNNLWKDLEAAGVGVIVYGRKGNSNTFKWNYNLRAVAKSAIDGKDITVKKLVNEVPAQAPQAKPVIPAPRKIVKEVPKSEKVEDTSKNYGKLIYIPLRQDYHLEIKMPSNITASEVDVIVNALRSAVK